MRRIAACSLGLFVLVGGVEVLRATPPSNPPTWDASLETQPDLACLTIERGSGWGEFGESEGPFEAVLEIVNRCRATPSPSI
jgi:hypothetical protein